MLDKIMKALGSFIDRTMEDEVGIHAAHASFFMMISAIPCIMIILSIARNFVSIDSASAIGIAEQFIPEGGMSFVAQIIHELFDTSQSISLISITAVTALWSGSRGFMALEQGLSKIITGSKDRGYIKSRLLAYFYTLIFIILVNASLGFLVFGNRLEKFLVGRFSVMSGIFESLVSIRYIILPAVLTLYFAFMYKILPGLPIRRKRTIFPGAAGAAVGWMLFSRLYAFYIDNFAHYSYVYGSVAAIVLLMLWLYFCMNILLMGAELNEFIDIAKRRRREERRASVSGKSPSKMIPASAVPISGRRTSKKKKRKRKKKK